MAWDHPLLAKHPFDRVDDGDGARVELHVDASADLFATQAGDPQCFRDEVHVEAAAAVHLADGEAGAVERDEPLWENVFHPGRRYADAQVDLLAHDRAGDYGPGA